ncbi:MAG: hydrolase [Colwellia sp.]|nr:hydrolase [Colwellia sp.]MCW9081917.1 hydrolase [Colwellia sp.]
MYSASKFKPAWWLTNAHFQTLAAKFFRRNQQLKTNNETLELPDGDFIELAWTEQPQKDNTKPIVVMLHGLEGSKDSHYAKGMLSAIKARGWIAVLMHFRGCGGKPNRQASSYHSGDTRDISYLTEHLIARYQQCIFSVLGFSLGGNVLTQYLAQVPNNPYKAAAVICAPLDLSSCSARINQGFSRLYQKYLLQMLKDSTLEKITKKIIHHIKAEQLASIRTIFDFDDKVTAPLNGFNSAEHYYQQASGQQVMTHIKQPCLFVHAADDPFLNHQSALPKQALPEHITFEVSERGGHVGYIYGNNPFKPKFWLEKRVPDFLANYLTLTER